MREKAKRRGTPSSGEGVSKALWSTACAAPATTPSTLLRYSWARLDPERRLLQVRWSDATDRAGEVWNATKSGEEQEIVLPENIAASLVRHRKIQAEEKLAAEAKPGTWKRTPTSSSRTPRAESTAAPPSTRTSSATARKRGSPDALPRPERHRRDAYDPEWGGREDCGGYTRSCGSRDDLEEVRSRLAGHEGKGGQRDRLLYPLRRPDTAVAEEVGPTLGPRAAPETAYPSVRRGTAPAVVYSRGFFA
jgi:hypothetical protein